MSCLEPKLFHRELSATKWDNAAAKFILERMHDPVYAIQIGPESDIDRCWIFPGGVLENMTSPTADAQVRHSQAFRSAIKVSVESPYIGYVPAGPYAVLPPYGRSLAALSGGLERGSVIIGDAGWSGSMYGISDAGEGQPGLDPLLQLVFHRMPVPWLPTKRPPAEWVFNVDAWSAIGAPVSHIARVPGMGRRRLSLSMRMKDYTAGTLDWSFVGVNAVDFGTTTIGTQFHRETLETQSAVAANFDQSFAFDGEFDYYELTVTEVTALGAGTDLSAIIKAWD